MAAGTFALPFDYQILGGNPPDSTLVVPVSDHHAESNEPLCDTLRSILQAARLPSNEAEHLTQEDGNRGQDPMSHSEIGDLAYPCIFVEPLQET